MPDLHTWLSFVAATGALLILPRPTVLLVVSYARRNLNRAAGGFLLVTGGLLGLARRAA